MFMGGAGSDVNTDGENELDDARRNGRLRKSAIVVESVQKAIRAIAENVYNRIKINFYFSLRHGLAFEE
jgi:hypothetical protein